MKPLNLQEFAEELRRKGDWREVEFATQILDLIGIEEEVAEPYSTLCADVAFYAADFSNPDDAVKALEWLGDRSNLLADIEELFKAAGRAGDVDDEAKKLLENAPPAMEYDL